MPIMLYPKCWRNRDDCEPIHCIDGTDEPLTEEQMMTLDYRPSSFVCSGCVKPESRVVKQDLYRLCFKNSTTDEISDNDLQDLTSIMCVASAALSLDAVRKHAHGVVELPAEHAREQSSEEEHY